ncbi:MAG TPA: hypothetical protein VFX16_21160 [Pseudonocardiaceae bacterium]|nr:hypothetical protein [Pseudonocardiaceae bacterium]
MLSWKLRHLAYARSDPLVTVTQRLQLPHSNGTDRPQLPGADINRKKRFLAALSAAIVVLGAGLTIGITRLDGHHDTQHVAYTNISGNFKACLLTTTADTQQTAPTWSAIQSTARRRAINAQHLVAPPGTASSLVPYLNSLLSLNCQLIITAGADLVPALTTVAPLHPHQSFANISPTATDQPNIQDLTQAAASNVAQLLAKACQC